MMEHSLTPAHVRVLQVIAKNFWCSHVDRATEHQMRSWLERFQDANEILRYLITSKHLTALTESLAGNASLKVYTLSDAAKLVLATSAKPSTNTLPQILPRDSPLRLPLTDKSVRHLLQVAHTIFGTKFLTVERLRFSHECFGSQKMLKGLRGLDAEIAKNDLNAQISSFLTAAESKGYLIAVRPGCYQKTQQGINLVYASDIDLGLVERYVRK